MVARTAGSKLFQSRKLVEFSMVDSAVRVCIYIYIYLCVSAHKFVEREREGGKERGKEGQKHLLSCARTTFEGGKLSDRYCSAACKVINTVERRIVSLAC